MFQDDHAPDILQLDQTIQQNFETALSQQNEEYTNDIELSVSFRERLRRHHSRPSAEQETQKHFYFLDTAELIQEYKQNLKTPIKVNFLSPSKAPDEREHGKRKIISNFLETVKQYHSVDLPYSRADSSSSLLAHKDQQCIACESTDVTESTEYVGIMICLECGNQESTLNLANSIRLNHNDSKRVNICSKYSYDKKSHFLNCINQYQGKHKTGIEPEIIQSIEAELERYNLVDHTKKTKRGQYRNVSKEHIFLFVKELKLTKSYGDINLIHHLITGFPLNDISHLTEKLLQDFDQFVQMHHKQFPNEFERKNFNYQHLLYQLLLRHKYPCNPAEFNFLKTIDRKYYHDEICRTIFENLGWNYSSLF